MNQNNGGLNFRAGQTGSITARLNIVSVEDANIEGVNNVHSIKIGYADSDGAETASRVQLTIRSHPFNAAIPPSNQPIFTFDSNTRASTGAGSVTVALNDCPGNTLDFDFSQFAYWVEAVITRTDVAQTPAFNLIQIGETTMAACPDRKSVV